MTTTKCERTEADLQRAEAAPGTGAFLVAEVHGDLVHPVYGEHRERWAAELHRERLLPYRPGAVVLAREDLLVTYALVDRSTPGPG
jgi:hypothetical protein